ncbi:beta-microseminoprotein J1-like [Mobula birostris]|uniref:beta-microseminoprotein J1-like n=1 Tax=Mobula birostris TaxID=1983395 RepID=UPI003B27BA11
MIAPLSLWRSSLGTIMKLLLCIALLLLAAQLSESVCSIRRRIPPNGSGELEQVGCIDPYDGSLHPVGETWIDPVCMRCTCGSAFHECCTSYSTPSGYSEDCVSLFNPRECRYRVHRKDNPSIECEVHVFV